MWGLETIHFIQIFGSIWFFMSIAQHLRIYKILEYFLKNLKISFIQIAKRFDSLNVPIELRMTISSVVVSLTNDHYIN